MAGLRREREAQGVEGESTHMVQSSPGQDELAISSYRVARPRWRHPKEERDARGVRSIELASRWRAIETGKPWLHLLCNVHLLFLHLILLAPLRLCLLCSTLLLVLLRAHSLCFILLAPPPVSNTRHRRKVSGRATRAGQLDCDCSDSDCCDSEGD